MFNSAAFCFAFAFTLGLGFFNRNNKSTSCGSTTMRIEPIKPSPTFGYSNKLKTLYKKGKLPVKYGFYGDVLTPKNVSLEHLLPHSKGGKTELSNLVLASKAKNNARGAGDLKDYIDPDAFKQYVDQFIGFKTKGFDGNKYVSMILKTINELLSK